MVTLAHTYSNDIAFLYPIDIFSLSLTHHQHVISRLQVVKCQTTYFYIEVECWVKRSLMEITRHTCEVQVSHHDGDFMNIKKGKKLLKWTKKKICKCRREKKMLILMKSI